MARYIVAAHGGPTGHRPWQSRLTGVGLYQRANIVIPTESYPASDLTHGDVTGNFLGDGFDFSSIPSWVWLVGAGAAAYYFFGRKRA